MTEEQRACNALPAGAGAPGRRSLRSSWPVDDPEPSIEIISKKGLKKIKYLIISIDVKVYLNNINIYPKMGCLPWTGRGRLVGQQWRPAVARRAGAAPQRQLRHRARRLHARGPGRLQPQAQRAQRRGQPVRTPLRRACASLPDRCCMPCMQNYALCSAVPLSVALQASSSRFLLHEASGGWLCCSTQHSWPVGVCIRPAQPVGGEAGTEHDVHGMHWQGHCVSATPGGRAYT